MVDFLQRKIVNIEILVKVDFIRYRSYSRDKKKKNCLRKQIEAVLTILQKVQLVIIKGNLVSLMTEHIFIDTNK